MCQLFDVHSSSRSRFARPELWKGTRSLLFDDGGCPITTQAKQLHNANPTDGVELRCEMFVGFKQIAVTNESVDPARRGIPVDCQHEPDC
jgi:hypothetical protein